MAKNEPLFEYEGKKYTAAQILSMLANSDGTLKGLIVVEDELRKEVSHLKGELSASEGIVESHVKVAEDLTEDRNSLLVKNEELEKEIVSLKKNHQNLVDNGGVIMDAKKLDPKKQYTTGANGMGFKEIPTKKAPVKK